MKKKFRNMLKDNKKFFKAMQELSEEAIEFGLSYPIEDMIDYANQSMDEQKVLELEKMFEENIFLLAHYNGIEMLINAYNIKSSVEYERISNLSIR